MCASPETRSQLVAAIELLMAALIARDSEKLADVFARSRCERDDVYRVMDEYGASFDVAPRSTEEGLEITKIESAQPLYAADVDFWDQAGRKIDLTVQMTIEMRDGVALVANDDVRVM